MGLDTSHDCWHGAYSAFHRWRSAIAKAAGLPPLKLMEGFWVSPRSTNPSANTLEQATYQWAQKRDGEDVSMRPHESLLSEIDFAPISWDCLKPDPLHELLHHSDCDGEIPWESCTAIADRLADVMPNLPEGDGGGYIGNWRDKTQQFVDGLRSAADAKENVIFL